MTNTGNVTLRDPSINETRFTGSGGPLSVSCPTGAVAPNASVDCTASYTVTQADVDRGSIENTATATGTPPAGLDPPTSDPSSATVTTPQNPALTIEKSADPASYSAAGQTINYSFLIRNTGNVTMSNVGVNEESFSGAGTVSTPQCPQSSLAPGAEMTCTATYTVQAADLNASQINNSATATGTPPGSDTPIKSPPSDVSVNFDPQPSLALEKIADPTEASEGQTVNYTFRVTNTGNQTLTDVAIDETEFSGSGGSPTVTCPDGARSLAPGASVDCTASYVVTAQDVQNSPLRNTAEATGNSPSGDSVRSTPSSVEVTMLTSGIAVEKTADKTELVVGETINYTFRVSNIGETTLTDVSVAETQFTGSGGSPTVTCPDAAQSLAAGASVDCTASYTVTQADLDRGTIENTANASGKPPHRDRITSDNSTVTVPGNADPQISLEKIADPTEASEGQTVNYTFRVTNTGNVTLSNVGVNETAFSGSGGAPTISCPAGAQSLAPGASVDCTASYTVTALDVANAPLRNTAEATGNPPTGDPIRSSPSSAEVRMLQSGITIEKTADKTALVVGETVNYTFRVTNTGQTTLTDVSVAETEFTGSGPAPTVTCPDGAQSLAAGASVDCTASYTVTQADIDRGSVNNTANASGKPPHRDRITSGNSSVNVPANQNPSLEMTKTADPTTASQGQTVNYTFRVTNTGNVTLTNVGVNETEFSGSGGAPTITCPAGAQSLAPGASVDCTASYVVTAQDVENSPLRNTANATGNPPSGDPINSPPSSAEVTMQTSGIAVEKSADKTELVVGETINYTFRVTNTGQTTLTDVTVAETNWTGSGPAPAVTCPDGAQSLAAGASVDCTASYTVTQADLDRGTIENTANASGKPPFRDRITSTDSSVTVPGNANPQLSLEKLVDPTEASEGQTVNYTFRITNTGNVTLTNVGVNETEFSGSGGAPAVTCPDGAQSLAPGASVDCTASYVVTADDVANSPLRNTANATGTPPSGDPINSPPSSAEVTMLTSGITVEKTADKTELVVGETINYTFRVTNTGQTTLTDVSVAETNFTGSGPAPAITCPDAAQSLAPDASVDCTASYTVTQADLDRGTIENTANASGKPPHRDRITSTDSSVTVPGNAAPALELLKSSEKTDPLVVGETITYNFRVTNTGNVTMRDIAIQEGDFNGSGQLGPIQCPQEQTASLAPGASVTCSADYTVTQADVDRGSIDNSATATGVPPGSDTPVTSNTSTVRVPGEENPALRLLKTASPTRITQAGETIRYNFQVTNTGNVTVREILIEEGQFEGSAGLSDIRCPEAAEVLAPGETVSCSADYVATQEDVDRGGSISNTATATGRPPNGPRFSSDTSTVVVTVDQDPSIAVVKSVDKNDLVVGDTLTYSFVVTNTGNVTLQDVRVDEGEFTGSGQLSAIDCPADQAELLGPDQQMTCTATYVVTQADVDRGSVENTATSTGNPPNGGPPVTSTPSQARVPEDPQPRLELLKTADKPEVKLNDPITYSFAITNTGNVTIRDVAVNETQFSGTGPLSAIDCPDEVSSMAPGARVTCTATYNPTQEDVNRGSIENTATVTGVPPGDGPPIESPPSEARVPNDAQPKLDLLKTADKEVGRAGETLTYSFRVTNSGNVTMTDIAIREGQFSGTGQLSPVTCPAEAASLAPGASVTCTATYVVTDADAQAGSIENTATTTGVPPGGGPPVESPPSKVKTPIDPPGAGVPPGEQPPGRPGDPIVPPGNPPALPPTGAGDVATLLVAALMMLLIGAGLLGARRYRRRGTGDDTVT